MKEPSKPTPLPLPPPPLETTTVHLAMRRRVRHRAAISTITTSSQSSSLSSSPTSSLSTSSTSSSSIPFSWEHQPGIPKNANALETLALPLPLPPSRHSTGMVTIPQPGSGTGMKPVFDPFVAALSECAKEGFECKPVGTAPHVQQRSKNKAVRPVSASAISGRFGLLDLYGCKTAISVVDAAVALPQTGRRVSTYRVVSRRNRSEKR
jgi:Protein of unknown function (DUF688)